MAKYTVQGTVTMDINIVFTEIGIVTVTVGQGGSVVVGPVTIEPGTSKAFDVPVGAPFTFHVNPLAGYVAGVTVNGEVVLPDTQ